MNREVAIDNNRTLMYTDFYLHLLSCEEKLKHKDEVIEKINEIVKSYKTSNYYVGLAIEEISKIIDKALGDEN